MCDAGDRSAARTLAQTYADLNAVVSERALWLSRRRSLSAPFLRVSDH